MNGSDAFPASIVNKIASSRYITLDSLISSPILAGGASDLFMLPPCISSSSIDSPCDSCSACLLPTVHPGNALQCTPTKGNREDKELLAYSILEITRRKEVYKF